MWKKVVDFFSLFGSSATLICCAIPATLSVLVGGAAVGSFVSAFPWVIPISKHKDLLFLTAGLLLAFNGFLTLRPKGVVACTITGGKGCEVAGKFTKAVFWFSIGLYTIGALAAYALVPIMKAIGL